jgi:hypothetical protein
MTFSAGTLSNPIALLTGNHNFEFHLAIRRQFFVSLDHLGIVVRDEPSAKLCFDGLPLFGVELWRPSPPPILHAPVTNQLAGIKQTLPVPAQIILAAATALLDAEQPKGFLLSFQLMARRTSLASKSFSGSFGMLGT